MESNYHIPNEIVQSNILTRLPVRSLVRFKCVCKTWKQHIESLGSRTSLIFTTVENPTSIHQLIDLHSSSLSVIEHPLPPSFEGKDSLTIKCSCNDLFILCSRSIYENHYFVWNPSNPTAFHEVLPKQRVTMIHGFGYDRDSNDYKIIASLIGTVSHCLVICRLKSLDSCKQIVGFEKMYRLLGHFIQLNNCLHWISRGSDSDTYIVSFDLCNETWDQFSTPDMSSSERITWGMNLHNFYDGSLGFTVTEDLIEDFCHVWVMKEYGVSDSWMRLFSFPLPCEYKVLLLGSPVNSRVLLFNFYSKELVWYNQQLKEEPKIEQIEIQGGLKVFDCKCSCCEISSIANRKLKY